MRRFLVVAFVFLFALVLPMTARAAQQPGPRGNIVVFDGRTVVPADEIVNSVVVFHGRTVVAGVARGSVVVFDGQTSISGRVSGSVIVFRGHVDVASSAHIAGDLVTNGTPTVAPGATIEGTRREISGINLTGYSWVVHLLVWLAYTVSVLLLGLLLVGLLPGPMDAAATASRAIGATVGWGLIMLLGLPLAAALVMLSLVGIPLGLSVLLALWFLFTVGYTVGAFALGRRLVKPPARRLPAFFAGWGIARALALVPFLAGVAWTLLALAGMGAATVAVWRARRAVRDTDRGTPPAGAPQMMPAPPPPAGS
ncbi:MAG TPA: polymer-forming cytoskeletal protein [Actinomycetota bacterium]